MECHDLRRNAPTQIPFTQIQVSLILGLDSSAQICSDFWWP